MGIGKDELKLVWFLSLAQYYAPCLVVVAASWVTEKSFHWCLVVVMKNSKSQAPHIVFVVDLVEFNQYVVAFLAKGFDHGLQ